MIHPDVLQPRLAIGRRIKLGEVVSTGNGKTRPTKFEHFKVTTNERVGDNFAPDAVMEELGGKPTEIPITLLSDDIEEVFQTSLGVYSGRGVLCRGDGKTALRYWANKEKLPTPLEVQCPCPQLEAKTCKPSGVLSCMISVPGHAQVGSVDQFRTTSWNSISGILGSLQQIKTLANGVLTGFTLHLCVRMKTVTPEGQAPQKVPVAHLELREGDVEKIQGQARAYLEHRNANLEEFTQLGLRYKAMLVAPQEAVDVRDVAAEFYPDKEEPEHDPETGEVKEEISRARAMVQRVMGE